MRRGVVGVDRDLSKELELSNACLLMEKVLLRESLTNNINITFFELRTKVYPDDVEDFTLLQFSILHMNRVAFNMLLKYGAKIETVNNQRKNAVQMLAKRGLLFWLDTTLSYQEYIPECLQELLNRQDNNGCSPLHAATAQDQLSAVKWLLQRGADPNAAMYTTGWTPLMHAAHNCNSLITEILLANGADKNMYAQNATYLQRRKVISLPESMKKFLVCHGLALDKLKMLEDARENNIWMGCSYLFPLRIFYIVKVRPVKITAFDVAMQQCCTSVLGLLITNDVRGKKSRNNCCCQTVCDQRNNLRKINMGGSVGKM